MDSNLLKWMKGWHGCGTFFRTFFLMNLSYLHSMKRQEFITISIKEASAWKKAASFHSMNASEAFWMGQVKYRLCTDRAVQPFYYLLLTQSVDMSASFARPNEQRCHAAPCLRYFSRRERHDVPHTHTGTQTGGKTLFVSFGRQDMSACIFFLVFRSTPLTFPIYTSEADCFKHQSTNCFVVWCNASVAVFRIWIIQIFSPVRTFPLTGSFLTLGLTTLNLRQFFIPQPVKGAYFSSGDENSLTVFAKCSNGMHFSKIDSNGLSWFIRFFLLSIFIRHG